jgi:hypothetical protein
MTAGIIGFAMYIEASGSGESSNRLREKIGSVAVKELRSQWSGRLTTPETTPDQVQAALGPPDHADSSSLRYILPGHPGYVYVFEFASERKVLRRCGFQRLTARPAPTRSSDLDSYKRELVNMGATSSELRDWLGDPPSSYGWWPEEIWEYSDALILRLRHGVVERDE